MTDAAYCFTQDVRERSRTKQGAVHKKNGSKTKKCTMPSDRLTPAQKKKLNGKCITVQLNKPITDWKQFRTLPEHMQIEYINNLVDNYGARAKDISDMFGVTYSCLNYVCNKYDPPLRFKNTIGHGKMDDRFMDFLTAPEKEAIDIPDPEPVIETKTEEIQTETDVSEPEISQEEKTEKPFVFAPVKSMNLSASGSKLDILTIIENVLRSKIQYEVSIDIRVKEASSF